jgi:hypothetical protein
LFDDLCLLGGIATSVDHEISDLFRRDFEGGMEAFRQRRERDVPPFLREIAAYLAQFAPTLNNTYVRLIRELHASRHHALYATLNYDCLIELSGRLLGLGSVYRGFPLSATELSVLKLHGSCNFLPDTGTNVFTGGTFEGIQTIYSGPVRAVSPSEAIAYCRSSASFAPCMALYVRGKDVIVAPEFIAHQQHAWATAVERAARIYVVGVRVNADDRHVWEPLARARAPLFYVGPEKDTFLSWAAAVRRRRVAHLASDFSEAVPEIIRHATNL